MNIGFTGTQVGMTKEQRQTFTKLCTKIDSLHHGCCIGADKQVHDIATEKKIWAVLHPPLNRSKMAIYEGSETRRAKEYLQRNHDIVLETDLLIATPKEFNEQLRSGTWSTIRYARRVNKPILIILPNGKVQKG